MKILKIVIFPYGSLCTDPLPPPLRVFYDSMLLNLSPIDELGHWCLQSRSSRAMLQHEKEVSMATLRVAPTRHCHTNQFGGILTNQHLPGLDLKREEGMGKNKAQNGKQTASYCNNSLQRTVSKQLCIQVTRCPCQRHWATPSIAGKIADQPCFGVNFAQITFSLI